MRSRSRSTANRHADPPIPHVMAASHAPVAEPPQAPGSQRAAPSVRPLSPEEAERAARQIKGPRAPQPAPTGREPVSIPSLPPVPRAPARITPLVLILAQVLIDTVAIAGSWSLAYFLRLEEDIVRKFLVPPDAGAYGTMIAITVATLLVTFYFNKLYNIRRGASRVDEFYKIVAAISVGTVLSMATNSLVLGDRFNYPRPMLLLAWMLAIVFVTSGRLLYGLAVGQMRKAGLDRSRVLVIGTGPTAVDIAKRLDYQRELGYQVVGLIDGAQGDPAADGRARSGWISDLPVLGSLLQLTDVIRKYKVDEVIVALSGASDEDLRDVIGLIDDESVSVKIYPDAFQLMTQHEVSIGAGGLPLLSIKDVALRGWNRRLKRAFDVVFSLTVLVLTSPLMLLIAAAIKLTSPGPIFFIQERVGLDGRPFQLVKFRTMRADIDDEEVPRLGPGMPGWTVRNDPRRTKLGAFLRRFSLDELPQFYNVLVGEMSVVGPRPEQPEYVQQFAQIIRNYIRRHREKAGITGWAQVNGLRGDSSIELRTAYDLYYVENWSLLFDLKIIVRTIIVMFRGRNAY